MRRPNAYLASNNPEDMISLGSAPSSPAPEPPLDVVEPHLLSILNEMGMASEDKVISLDC